MVTKTKKAKVVVKKEAAVKAPSARAKKPALKVASKPKEAAVSLKAPRIAVTKTKKAPAAKPRKEKSAPILEKASVVHIAQPPAPSAPVPPLVKEQPKQVKVEKPSPVPVQSVPAHKPVAVPVVKPKDTPVASKPAPVPKAEVKQDVKVVVPSPVVKSAPVPAIATKELELVLPISLKDLAVRLQEKSSVLIKQLMDMGIMVGINQMLEEPVLAKICAKYNYVVVKAPGPEELALKSHTESDDPKLLQPRGPIVTFMGHVDHGKTSLLDAVRQTKVVDSEHGGITQHIGAYRVRLSHGEITFLDTPGHEAFTAMRARGASVTDIVVLVVAADDGIMPQTQEAIDHARAAGVPIIVALNKMDKSTANPDRVKKQLAQLELTAEDWGGKTVTVPVSAKTGMGIDNLLEMILLEAQMLELKANQNRLAKGVVLEAKISKGRGPVATLLVQNGTLRLNETILVGNFCGKIRAMFNDHGQAVTAAGPAVPVEVLGISGVPEAGEQFYVFADEKQARELAQKRMEQQRLQQMKAVKRISLDDLYAQIQEGKVKELKLVVKADVQGSLEAIKDTLNKLNVSEIKITIIHEGVGNINSSDVILAVASDALIVGFNIVADDRAKDLASKEGVDVRIYNIIYELANEIKAALEGMLEPKLKKVFIGKAEVRKVLTLSRSGTIAGCFVVKGKFTRNNIINLLRNGQIVYEGKLASLKRFKDDVREVAEGFECGISLAGFDKYQEGDIIEAYDIEKIARKL